MDQLSPLPLLPSERKSKAREANAQMRHDISSSFLSHATTALEERVETNCPSSSSSSGSSSSSSSSSHGIIRRKIHTRHELGEDDAPSKKLDTLSKRKTNTMTHDPQQQQQQQQEKQEEEDHVLAREQQLESLSSLPPLPVSMTSEYLLEYFNTTTEFMNKFEYEVAQKIDACCHKIDSIDRRVGLMESRQRSVEKG